MIKYIKFSIISSIKINYPPKSSQIYITSKFLITGPDEKFTRQCNEAVGRQRQKSYRTTE